MNTCDVLIIGSGPGGATIANSLMNMGLEVIMIESGPFLQKTSPYSSEEMDFAYKFAGIRPFIGSGRAVLAEAECVGGGSQVNAGIYFRTPHDILKNWARKTKSDDFLPENLTKYFEEIEKELEISKNKAGLGLMSKKIVSTANKLNINFEELERWLQTNPYSNSWKGFKRFSMVNTLLEEALKKGLEIRENTKALKILFDKNYKATGALVKNKNNQQPYKINSKFTFLCGGATSSPHLLNVSGYRRKDKQKLEIHQMSRILARFPSNVNQLAAAIPAVQISEYKPNITLGASFSSIPLMSLVCPPNYIDTLESNFMNHHLLYCLYNSESTGRVLNFPFLGETVFYSLSKKDYIKMKDAYIKLLKFCVQAGAEQYHISDSKLGGVSFENEDEAILYIKSRKFKPEISSIHAFSSCPVGADCFTGTVDTKGKTFFADNLYIADSSILPGSTCLNPQGTVMAISKMIASKFINDLNR